MRKYVYLVYTNSIMKVGHSDGKCRNDKYRRMRQFKTYFGSKYKAIILHHNNNELIEKEIHQHLYESSERSIEKMNKDEAFQNYTDDELNYVKETMNKYGKIRSYTYDDLKSMSFNKKIKKNLK